MAQFPNETRQKANTDPQLLVKQWRNLNQEKYIKSELGLQADGILQAIFNSQYNGIPAKVFKNEIPFGLEPDTAVESWRGLELIGGMIADVINYNYLIAFPFSMWKPNDQAIYASDRIDSGNVLGVDFTDVSMPLSFMPDAYFANCKFDKSNLNRSVVVGALFEDITVFDSNLKELSGLDSTNQDPVYFGNSWFRDSILTGSRMNMLIETCTFEGCRFDHMVGYNDAGALLVIKDGSTVDDCHFVSAEISPRCNLDKGGYQIINSYFNKAIIENAVKPPQMANIINCEFDNAVITDATIYGDFTDNSMRNVEFKNSINFATDTAFPDLPDIAGTNFEGSNIDDFYTQQELKNAVGNWNSNTIWVDGTPF